jgi:hypothetical protein
MIKLLARFFRRRTPEPSPWTVPMEKFQELRDAIPVSEEEIKRAKFIMPGFERCDCGTIFRPVIHKTVTGIPICSDCYKTKMISSS